MRTNKNLILLALVALSLQSCGTDHSNKSESSEIISVKVSTVNVDQKEGVLNASGKIEAVNSANLSTRMMGYVNKIYVNIGEKVKKGQLLVSISNNELQAQRAQVNAKITEASAAVNNAKKDYERYKNLYEQNSASQKEFDDVTANFKMAKARLEAANEMKNEIAAQFAYINIRAPFNGVVINTFIDEGDMANPGVPLLAIEGPGKFEVTAMVPENEISNIKSGIPVAVFIKAIDTTIKAQVSELSISAKNTGGQYLMKAVLDDTEAPVLSGMYATVMIPTENKLKTSTVYLPKDVLVKKGQLTGIYTLSEQQTAILRWLRIGKTFGDKVEVLSGLNPDESYIVSAKGKLYNGAKVSIE
ncbi:RND family efflux transporter, MFP subunit [Zhouia amylolytica]|uniref:RND family efflux transporter, MFP subunit n=1 Tax=Zhouia amylolytica TaxID=376730 RepID=A0A1I6UFX7_9FLAO|nr:efflux RND transporter periplasmic adaptor subunit [Zhouia amylolytica]SFT00284.1 RND family efflux transporter, MFP subunit [Zhouia amylolytica]